MTERLIHSPSSPEESTTEIAALPSELRAFLNRSLTVEACPTMADVKFPAYCFTVSLGGYVTQGAIDVALLGRAYSDGGMDAVIEFVFREMKAFALGLTPAVLKDVAA